MRICFRQLSKKKPDSEKDVCSYSLLDDIAKTRFALETAYAGFDNATDPDMIDCYIYEVNSVMKRYKYLLELASRQQADATSHKQKEQVSEHRPLPVLP